MKLVEFRNNPVNVVFLKTHGHMHTWTHGPWNMHTWTMGHAQTHGTCTQTHGHRHMDTCTHTHTWTHTHMDTHMHTRAHGHTHAHMGTWTHTYTLVHADLHRHAHTLFILSILFLLYNTMEKYDEKGMINKT